MKKLALVVVSLVFLAGQFGGKVRKLEVGMARTEVVELLGRPDGVRSFQNTEALTYANRRISGFGWDRADYVVVLTDGRVSEYGPGTIRQVDPNTGMFIFVPL